MGTTGLPALDSLTGSGRIDVLRDASLARALSELAQDTRALLHAEGSFSPYGADFRAQHPAAITEKLVRLPDGEYNTVGVYDLAKAPDFPLFLSDVARAADGFDAYVRDGVKPWAASSRRAHARLDALLGVEHGRAARPR